jgi:epoxyqueuosine reductase
MGSFFFIGELIVDVPLATDGPMPDYCGTCTRCIDACPTDAIYEPYAVDATRCISYLTIEHKANNIPEALQPDMKNWIFGCDICQDVCPWNKFKYATDEPAYFPREGVTETDLREWAELNLDEFEKRFAESPVERASFEGFRRNVRMALENAMERQNKHPDASADD